LFTPKPKQAVILSKSFNVFLITQLLLLRVFGTADKPDVAKPQNIFLKKASPKPSTNKKPAVNLLLNSGL